MTDEKKETRGRPKTRSEPTNETYVKGLEYEKTLIEKKKQMVLDLVSKGYTPKEATTLLEIPNTKLIYWRTHDASFSEKLIKSQLKLKQDLVANIVNAGQKDWKASAWLLQHLPQFKEEFSEKTTIAVEEKTQSSSVVINMINQVLQVKDPELVIKQSSSLDIKQKPNAKSLANLRPRQPKQINLLEDADKEGSEDD
jgi:hypothetical protein